MPRGVVSVEVDAPCEQVFDLIHDYARRLEWDTLLSDAHLVDGAPHAGVGVRSLCTGNWSSAFLAFETEYIRFERGKVAAVRLTNSPPFFGQFAATIRHVALGENRSRVTYIYFFRVHPAWQARLLERIMHALLRWETTRRLHSLARYISHVAQ